jgi:tetratricopeptide (TPR) repeat protein
VPGAALADQRSKRELAEERAKYAVDPRTNRILGKAREHLAADRADDAKKQLDRLRLDRLGPPGRAQANRLYGYIAYGKEQNVEAIELLKKSLAEDGLAPAERADVLFQIAQIQGAERRWKDVLATLDQWFASVEKPNSVGYFLQAVSYYQLEDPDSALLPATKAVQIAKKPQSAWLQLLLAIHLSKKDYAAATPVLTQLIELYPSIGKGYWAAVGAVRDGESRARRFGVEVGYRRAHHDSDCAGWCSSCSTSRSAARGADPEQELAAGRIKETRVARALSSAWLMARGAQSRRRRARRRRRAATCTCASRRCSSCRRSHQGGATAAQGAFTRRPGRDGRRRARSASPTSTRTS